MPRLPAKLVEERENFAKDCFRKGMSLDRAQDCLSAKYDGMKMAPKRLAELQVEIKLNNLHTATRPELQGVEAPTVDADLKGKATVTGTGTIDESAQETVEEAIAYSMDATKAEARAIIDQVRAAGCPHRSSKFKGGRNYACLHCGTPVDYEGKPLETNKTV